MTGWRDRLSPARRFFELVVRRRRPEAEDADELAFHLAMKVDALERAGLEPDRARVEAARQIGDPTTVVAAVARIDRLANRQSAWREWIGGLGDDLRVAVRRLARAPGYTLANLAMIGLGVGACLVLGGVARAVLLRPLPLPAPEQLFSLMEADPAGQFRLADYPTFLDWRAEATTIRQMAFVRGNSARWAGTEATERVLIGWVSPDFFPLLGRSPLLGRAFGAGSGERVAVVTYRFWQDRLGGDPAVVGRVVTIDAEPVEVVGVMPRGVGYPTWAELWMPFDAMPVGVRRSVEQRGVRADGRLVARLADGRTVDEARVEMAVIAERQAARFPVEQGDFRAVRFVPLLTESLQTSQAALGDPTQPLRYLAVGLALVLLATVANLANLAVARTAERSGEMTVRASLGAARSRLARLVAIETSIVAFAGGLLGCAIGVAGLAVVRRRAAGLLPRADEISFDPPMVWGAAALVAMVVVLIGILPAAASLRAATDGSGGATHRVVGRRAQRRMQRGLVAAQIAFAVVMTIGAMLVTRSLVRSLEVPLGFDAEALATVHVDPNAAQYQDPERLVALYRQVAAEIAAIPGVDATTIVNHAPLTSGSMPTRVLIDDEDAADPAVARTAMFLSVGADYFATLAIPIRRGRGFDAADLAAVNGSVIVNEGFARRLWPGVDPIGRRLVVFRSVMGRADFGQPIEGRVVGVVGDVQQFGRENSPPDAVYLPFTWNPWSHTQIVARVTSGRPSDLVGVMEKTMHRLHPDLATRGAGGATIRTMVEVDRRSALPRRMLTALIVGFGASTLALVFVGLYAVVAYLTAQRTREIGVRMALGATASRVMEMVFKEAANYVLLGLAIGVAIGLAGAGVARGVVFGIGTRDPAAFLAAIVVLGAVAMAACAGPARRAARTDPSVVMRNE